MAPGTDVHAAASDGTTAAPSGSAAASSPAPPAPAPAAPEVEPQLKYEELGGDVREILNGDRATCLKLSEKILALGTEKGRVHVLDYSGNEVGQAALRLAARVWVVVGWWGVVTWMVQYATMNVISRSCVVVPPRLNEHSRSAGREP